MHNSEPQKSKGSDLKEIITHIIHGDWISYEALKNGLVNGVNDNEEPETTNTVDQILALIRKHEAEAEKRGRIDELHKADGFTDAEYTIKRLRQLNERESMSRFSKYLHKHGIHYYSIPIERFEEEVWYVQGTNGAGDQMKAKIYKKMKCLHCNKRKIKLESTYIRTYL